MLSPWDLWCLFEKLGIPTMSTHTPLPGGDSPESGPRVDLFLTSLLPTS